MNGEELKRERRFDEPLVWRIFQRRGTIQILLLLDRQGSARFNEIDRRFPTIARKTLGGRLVELREIGIVQRTVDTGPPIATHYTLSKVGERLARAAKVLDEVAESGDLISLAA
ncbi:MAG: helix-turn-helix transcriptional regulator [Solirubrobacterales bacterium]|nr:helix-turn-helix transcriptional regulator [Solirubrobacterales bacterium]